MPDPRYDALLLVSFGGPERPADVLPFLENVARGRAVPPARLKQVAEHYHQFGGVSPINGQNRALLAAIRADFAAHGLGLPVYWGNRNWHPLLPDTLRQMRADGVRRALAFVTAAYSSYSSCRQYREDITRAQAVVGDGVPVVDKLRHYFNHPGFVEPMAWRTRAARATAGPDAPVSFVAHSIPVTMAATSGPGGGAYPRQLAETARLVAELAGAPPGWTLAYCSRSGPPAQPWLEPDVLDHLGELAARGFRDLVLVPIGFVSDHMEVVYDLDTQARETAQALGVRLTRAATVGSDPRFVAMVRELVLERLDGGVPRPSLGRLGPSHDVCPDNCCPPPRRPAPVAQHPELA